MMQSSIGSNILAQQTNTQFRRVWKGSPIISEYVLDRSFISFVLGPYGSGKSVGSFMKLVYLAQQQAPANDGIRYTRWVVIRNTAQNLQDTAIKTWFEWLPDGLVGSWRASKNTFHLGMDDAGNINLMPVVDDQGNVTYVYAEVLFRSLDRPDQMRDLLGLELTGAIMAEWRELDFDLLLGLSGRVGRFPAKASGAGPSWRGIIGDSNPPPGDGAYFRLFEEQSEEKAALNELFDKSDSGQPFIQLFKQPGGMDPLAENLDNLDGGRAYYQRMIATAKAKGMTDDWINVHVHALYGSVVTGKPVYGGYFDERKHVAQVKLHPHPGYTIGIGVDPGVRWMAFALGQKWPDGTWVFLRELVLQDIGMERGLRYLETVMARDYPDHSFRFYVDPAARQRAASNLISPLSILEGRGYRCEFGPEHIEPRVEALRSALHFGAQIDKGCEYTLRGMRGDYYFRRVNKSGEFYTDVPEKTESSHIMNAWEYLVGYHEAPSLNGGVSRFLPINEGSDIRNGRKPPELFKRPPVVLYR